MPFMPFHILGIWFRGLLSIAILAGAIYLLKRWYDESHVVAVDAAVATAKAPAVEGDARERDAAAVASGRRVFRFEPGLNRPTALLAAGLALLTLAAVGGPIRRAVSMNFGGPNAGAGDEDPRDERTGEVHLIKRPDGSELRVECYGPAKAPPLIMTHGWGCNSTEWFYPKKHLAGRFRVILWDEPGLGLSKKPDNNDYHLDNLAADLDAVIKFAGSRPVVLVGHSIGGMITLNLCKILPETIKRHVAGLVLVHTSYTNPVRTTRMAALYTAIEKPVIVPLLYLTIAIWPLVWLMNWMGYFNGSVRKDTARQSFGGTETQGQLDFCARYVLQARPDIMARGMLGMIAYDATAALPTIPVPTLVIVGDQDDTTPPEAGQYIQQNVPNARLATLSPAKHMGLIEHNGRFDELVGEFAESCLATGVTS